MSDLNEAAGGAVAAAVSSIIFYPLELKRIRAHKEKIKDNTKINRYDVFPSSKLDSFQLKDFPESLLKNLLSTVVQTLQNYDGIACLSISNTMFASFIYYLIYEKLKWVVARNDKSKLSWTSNLIIANAAAVLSVIITFPIDGIICRAQVKTNDTASVIFSQLEERSSKELGENKSGVKSCFFDDFFAYFRGITPAIALCLNPTVHYTVYDKLKNFVKVIKSTVPSESGSLVANDVHITPFEAFLIGFIAKIVATLVSYPLVRAKILLMTKSKYDYNQGSNGVGPDSNVCTVCNNSLIPYDHQTASMRSEEFDNIQSYLKSTTSTADTSQNDISGRDDMTASSDADIPSNGVSQHDLDQAVSTNPQPSRLSSPVLVSSPVSQPCTCELKPRDLLHSQSDIARMFRILYMLAVFEGFSGLYQGLSAHILHSSLRGALSMSLKEFFVKQLRKLNALLSSRR